MVSELLRRRPGALAGRPRHRPVARHAAGWPAPVSSRSTGVRHTAEHIVVATGSDPIVPPLPGLRELEGVWGTREATSMKAVPRRLLVLGGGSAGVELAQVVRRLGGEAVIVEGADRVLPREPAPLGTALAEALRRDGIELRLGMHASAARREGDEYVLRVRRRSGAAGRPPARRHRSAPARRGNRPRDRRRRAQPPRDRGGRSPARRRAPLGDRRRHRHLAADPRRRVRGRRGRGEHRGRCGARRTTKPSRASPTPIRRPRRWARPKRRTAPPHSCPRCRGPPPIPTPTPSPTGS